MRTSQLANLLFMLLVGTMACSSESNDGPASAPEADATAHPDEGEGEDSDADQGSDSDSELDHVRESRSAPPYRNPALADSLWPVFHGNNYATASVSSTGPGPVTRARVIDALTEATDDPFVSPWTVLGSPYPDGSQPVITTPNDGVAKYLTRDGELKAVDFLPLERSVLDFDWALMLLRNNDAVVTERAANRIVVVGDEFAGEPESPLRIKRRIDVDIERYGALLSHHALAPDGSLIALTEANRLIALDLDEGEVIADYGLPSDGGASFQNSFPIDENGRIFVAAQSRSVAIDWDGEAFVMAWSAGYDMRGPGCGDVPLNRTRREEILAVSRGEPCTGTGTTPSLIGQPRTGVFVIVDGHAPKNRLVAFWRDRPPASWQALTDPQDPDTALDRQVAGVFPLPLSTPEGSGFTAQNSPAVLDHAIVIAQWAGFAPGRTPPSGVQRVDWLADERRFELMWENPDVLFNGVPLIACAASQRCQTYGMGRYGSDYDYTSLDLETGMETGRVALGTDDRVLDQGNGHAVTNDGAIIYAGKDVLVRVE